jgi:hypothetical protein
MRDSGWPDWAPLPLLYRAPPGLQAFVGREHCGGVPTSPRRWHISLRGSGRIPTWAELVEAAHALRPRRVARRRVPPRSQWMNVHLHVLQL